MCVYMFETVLKLRNRTIRPLAMNLTDEQLTAIQLISMLAARFPEMFAELLLALAKSDLRLAELPPGSAEKLIEERFDKLLDRTYKKYAEALDSDPKVEVQVRKRLSKANRICALWQSRIDSEGESSPYFTVISEKTVTIFHRSTAPKKRKK